MIESPYICQSVSALGELKARVHIACWTTSCLHNSLEYHMLTPIYCPTFAMLSCTCGPKGKSMKDMVMISRSS